MGIGIQEESNDGDTDATFARMPEKLEKVFEIIPQQMAGNAVDSADIETPREMSRVGLRNADYRNSIHSLGTKSNDIYTDSVNENIDLTRMRKYTTAQENHESDKTKIGKKMVGGMAAEPYQHNERERDNDNQFLLEKVPGLDGENIRHVDSEERRNMDAETDNINSMLNSLSDNNKCTNLLNADLDQINIKSDYIVTEGSSEAESGHDELKITDPGDKEYRNVYQLYNLMSSGKQEDCVKKSRTARIQDCPFCGWVVLILQK